MSPFKTSLPFPRLRRRGLRRNRGPWGKIEDLLRYLAATLFALLTILLILGVPTLLVVTSTHGLGDTARKRIEETLEGARYRVTIDRVLFNPMQGVIIDGLQLHDRTANRLVLSADRLSISVKMESLLRQKLQLERIFLRDATLDVPLGPAEEPRLRLDHVRGLILCPPGEFRLTTASFEVAGIAVHASGTFLNPKGFSPMPVSQKGPGDIARAIDSIQKQLREVHWKEAPELTIEASGDLSDAESLTVEKASLHSGAAFWRGVALRESALDLHFEHRKITLDKLMLHDAAGVLEAAGWGDFAANKASLEFTGAFNPGALPALLLKPDAAKDWNWIDPLHLNGNLSATWGTGTKPVLSGYSLLEGGRFQYRGIAMEGFSGGVAVQDGKVLVRDFHLQGSPGKLDADLLIAPGDYRARIKLALFPARLVPVISGKAREALAAMDFKEPLRVTFEGSSPTMNPLLFKGSGSLELKNAAMHGAGIGTLNATIQLANGSADFRDIVLKINDGVGRGEFIYDFKNWEGRLPEVRSTLDPVTVMTWIDTRVAAVIKDYRFQKPPSLLVTGKVGLRDPEKNNLNIAVNAPSGLGYTLIKKNLPFGAASGTVRIRGQKVLVDIPKSKLFGGSVTLKAEASAKPGDPTYGASVHLEDVDFETVTKLYFDYTESKGELTADYTFRALGGNDHSMTGQGNILLKNGNVMAMPILGPLSLLLNEVVPGFGYQSAHKATADFTVGDGVISTRNLLIAGVGFSMIGHGDIDYLDDKMDMSIRLNAQGLPGLMLFPVSKIFEYESVGSAQHPKWRPKILPKGKPKR